MPNVAEINPSIDAFLAKGNNIQAMPENTIRILRLTRDSNCDIGQLLKLIERDAALSARIMRAVNSSFYALETKMVRLDQAVGYMGLKAVKQVTAASSLSGLCKEVTIGSHNARELWDYSVGVAVVSRELAVHSKMIDPEDAFLAGMLHDVGLLLAVQSDVPKCKTVFQEAETGDSPFTDVEQRVFGFNHCELGERLSQQWNFPEYVTSATRWHHEPESAPDDFKPLCRHIFIADHLCCAANIGFPLTCSNQEISEEMLESSQLSRQTIIEVKEKIPVLLRLFLS